MRVAQSYRPARPGWDSSSVALPPRPFLYVALTCSSSDNFDFVSKSYRPTRPGVGFFFGVYPAPLFVLRRQGFCIRLAFFSLARIGRPARLGGGFSRWLCPRTPFSTASAGFYHSIGFLFAGANWQAYPAGARGARAPLWTPPFLGWVDESLLRRCVRPCCGGEAASCVREL